MPDEVKASSPDASRAAAGKKGAKPPDRKVKADVLVDHDLCKACGICLALCSEAVFETDAGGAVVVARPEDCTVCRLCEWHCPDFAIEVVIRGREAAPAAAESSRSTAPDRREA